MLERLESIRRGENGGKTLEGKKKGKKKKKKNAVEASRVHENVRDRGEERLDEGARSKGS